VQLVRLRAKILKNRLNLFVCANQALLNAHQFLCFCHLLPAFSYLSIIQSDCRLLRENYKYCEKRHLQISALQPLFGVGGCAFGLDTQAPQAGFGGRSEGQAVSGSKRGCSRPFVEYQGVGNCPRPYPPIRGDPPYRRNKSSGEGIQRALCLCFEKRVSSPNQAAFTLDEQLFLFHRWLCLGGHHRAVYQ